jgi:hypothetical protein
MVFMVDTPFLSSSRIQHLPSLGSGGGQAGTMFLFRMSVIKCRPAKPKLAGELQPAFVHNSGAAAFNEHTPCVKGWCLFFVE